ncbi:hypothetical protein [Zhihengliuella sp.]|uniref:PH-like domain-containing protein n=1 Tax=Zhihengliuella sp. TaxID=1954483 RepID=UPI0028128487|nr:hypothetical protein [Zhihengliuella sp.]
MSDYGLALAATLGVAAVLVLLIVRGWRGRLKRQSDVAEPRPAPRGLGEPLASADGQYVSTTTAGDWLDRIAVHTLGYKANATLTVHPEGVLYARSGARDVFVPARDAIGVRRESGMAGKFVERDGLIVLEWRLGGRPVDTGFRARRPEAVAAVLSALEELTAPAAGGPTTTPDAEQPEQKDTK